MSQEEPRALEQQVNEMEIDPGGVPNTPVARAMSDFRFRSGSDSVVVQQGLRGAKRLATSPLEGKEIKDLSPITDVDLQKMKDDLDSHDYNFASINAVSKESATKKKELELIMAAYRRAINKLTMAYLTMKAERDTTLRIWGMIKTEVQKSNAKEEAESIKEMTKTTIREALTEWQHEETCTTMGPTGSYANAVKVNKEAQGGATWATKRNMEPRQQTETIEVAPTRENEKDYADATATKQAVLKTIKPDEMGIKIDRLIRGRNKTIKIVAPKGELNKMKQALTNAGMEIKTFDNMNPRLIIRDIPTTTNKEEAMQCLMKQNLEGVADDEIKMVYFYPPEKRKSTNMIIEVTPEIRRRLLARGRIYMGWSSCRIMDHIRVTQCYKCLAIGHIAKVCRAEKDICGHCAGDHESRACNKKETLKCHNCTKAKLTELDHSAFDTNKCAILKRKINERVNMIHY
ncbi:uncharacterized protein [Cardiocondyla obscurior]|uniref:uncharacterized protein n=1 Tax=Cardiocondyla obscurior TaxID=286306 RepID=UPI0039656F09